MKAIKKISLILCLTVLALTGITACNRKTEKKSESKEVTQTEKKEEKTEKTKDENKKVRTITDHAGNKVEVPEKVKANMKSFYKNQKFSKI